MNSTIIFQKSLWWWLDSQNLPKKRISINNTLIPKYSTSLSTDLGKNTLHLTNIQLALILVFVALVLLIMSLIIIYSCCYHKQEPVKEAKELEIVSHKYHQNSQAQLTLYHVGGGESSTIIDMDSSISSLSTLCPVQATRTTSRFQEHF